MGNLLCGCVEVRTAISNRPVIWRGEWGGPRHSCIRWGSTCLKGEWAVSGMVSGIFRHLRLHSFEWGKWREKCTRLVCEKLTVFPYGHYIVEFYVRLAFWWYSQVQDRSGGWTQMYTIVTVKTRKMVIPAVPTAMMPLVWPRFIGLLTQRYK